MTVVFVKLHQQISSLFSTMWEKHYNHIVTFCLWSKGYVLATIILLGKVVSMVTSLN